VELPRNCPSLKAAMPQVAMGGTVKFLSKNTSANILGATEVYTDINNHKVTEGSFLSKTDVQGQSLVAVLGAKVKSDLFGGRPAVGEKIKVMTPLGGRQFTVLGVMEEKGNVGMTNVDEQVIIPVTTAMDKIYGLKFISTIIGEAVTPKDEDIEKAKAEIKRTLRQRHKIRAGQPDDFQVMSQKELVQQFGSFTKIIGVVLFSIAGISLAVGGIGIMNIMLVSVTERTREIGVRMAMGAQRLDVLKQFLVEASIVSFLGGAVGVAMGWGLATTIEKVTRIVEVITTPFSIVLALTMATVVGIVSGIYPAWKASRLDPVEALRYE
ncbi:MAG TPA: ABC transporter permease, partial [Phycisphaerae bacterium]|nr:ABC transporter permease [Phycisphaerae bacterium]